MSEVPISVCIIAKNEEKHIENCLKHLQGYGFEIVVTDTGSTDNTRQIAQKYADKVLDFEWINDFSKARNFCAAMASNDWILALDCDEYVSYVDIDGLIEYMKVNSENVGEIKLKNLLLSDDDKEKYSIDKVIRFYNKKYFEFILPIHEQIYYKGASEIKKKLTCVTVPINALHYGYAISKEEMLKKQQRNLELLYKSLEKDKGNAYTLFQIAQSEFAIEDYENALKHYMSSLEINHDFDLMYVQIAIVSAARTFIALNRFQDALAFLEEHVQVCHDVRFHFVYSSTLLINGQKLKALMMFIKTTTLPDADNLGEDLRLCYNTIISLYKEMGNEEMASLFQKKYESLNIG